VPEDVPSTFTVETQSGTVTITPTGSAKARQELASLWEEIKTDLAKPSGLIGSGPVLSEAQIRAITKLPALVTKAIEAGVTTGAEFVAQAAEHMGDWVRTHAQEAWDNFSAVSPKNSSTDDLRSFLDLPARKLPDVKTWAEAEQLAKAKGYSHPDMALAFLEGKRGKALDTVGNYVAANRLSEIKARVAQIKAAFANGSVSTSLQEELTGLRSEAGKIINILNRSGNKAAVSLSSRRMIAKVMGDTFDEISVKAEVAARLKNHEAEMTADQERIIEGMTGRYQKAQAKLTEAVDNMRVARAKQALKTSPDAKGRLKVTDEAYQAAVSRLNSASKAGRTAGYTTIPSDMSDLAVIAAYKIQNKVKDFEQILQAMREADPTVTPQQAADGIVEAKKYLYPGTKRVATGPTIADLMKQVDVALGAKQPAAKLNALQELQKAMNTVSDRLATGIGESEWKDAQTEINELARRAGMGRSFGEDFMRSGPYGIETPEIAHMRRQADIILAEGRRQIVQWEQKAEWDNLKGLAKLGKTVLRAPNIIRPIMATGDDSAIGRQGLLASFAHPWNSAKSFIQHYKGVKNAASFDGAMSDLKAQLGEENWHKVVQSGVQLFDATGAHEEHFAAGYLGGISRQVGKLAGPFERPYQLYLNNLRARNVTTIANGLLLKGEVSDEGLKLIGDFVNASTGTMQMGNNEYLNFVFWAPKFVGSRVRMLLPVDAVKAMAIGEGKVGATLGYEWAKTVGAFYLLGNGANMIATRVNIMREKQGLPPVKAHFELDPYQTDFGKMRIGDITFDMTGGTGQYLRIASRELRENDPQEMLRIIAQAERYKFSPFLDFAMATKTGKDAIGRPQPANINIEKHTMPMSASNALDALWLHNAGKEEKSKQQRVSAILDAGGFASNVYPKPPKWSPKTPTKYPWDKGYKSPWKPK